jgi:hypothetical protein
MFSSTTKRIGRIVAASGIAAAALLGASAGTATAAPGNQVPPDKIVMLMDGNGNVLEDSGGVLQLGFRNNQANERWVKDFRTIGGAVVVLKNVETGRCVFNESVDEPGGKITLGACNLTNQAHNKWLVTPPDAKGFQVYRNYHGSGGSTSGDFAMTFFAKPSLQKFSGSGNQLLKDVTP